ncbi:hypothetical protein DY000_02053574 [Brassica cretica]|uniref:Aminotransferase-like plant mobile domain-containing protein n=1 Tax=Brassica cretica TaxID=69181 RepID=A0ABQ7A5C2_BRACR|nr:hypothetical protein DY000_02053574 [Brassica cretica]
MANKKFGPHLPTILDAKHIEAIYELWGVDYTVEIELPGDNKTPETVRPGYCRAYKSHFEDGGLSFPLPRFLLEVLVELGIAFTQMAPIFFRYFLASWVRAREEGLEFGLDELKQMFAIKRNSGFPDTMNLAPRAGRSIIDGIPNRDDWWREKFFVFKINPASVGDFDFRRIPREWSDEIEPFGSAPMTPELRGLIATLRSPNLTCSGAREREALPDHPEESSEAGSMERAQKARRMPTLRSKSQAQSPGFMARPVSIAVPAASSNSPSSGLPPPLRASGEGTSRVDPSAHLPEASSWGFSYDNEVPILKNPERLALIWRKIRERGCELPSLGNMREREAYVRMAVANAKAMEARNEYAALMEKQLAEFPSKEEVGSHLLTIQQLQGALEAVRVTEQQRGVEIEGLKGKLSAAETERVAVQNDLDLMKEKHWREIKGLDVAARKERDFSHRSLAREYNAVLAVVKDKLQKKKKETAAETRLQEVRARIETLTEYIEGGFELEEELEHLRGHEISLDLDYGLASVSDPSLSRLELPDISGDSVDQE